MKEQMREYVAKEQVGEVDLKKDTFTFSVVGDPPKFTYDPEDAWVYSGDHTLFFETGAGPFTLDLIRTDAVEGANPIQPFPPLRSEPVGDKHVATTTITDGRSPELRDSLRLENRTPDNPFGFIGRYRYKIQVEVPNALRPAYDESKNGEYKC